MWPRPSRRPLSRSEEECSKAAIGDRSETPKAAMAFRPCFEVFFQAVHIQVFYVAPMKTYL